MANIPKFNEDFGDDYSGTAAANGSGGEELRRVFSMRHVFFKVLIWLS